MVRATIAEAQRFPELSRNVHDAARGRSVNAVSQLLNETTQKLARSPKGPFTGKRSLATAQIFLDLILLPMLFRSLVGETPKELRRELPSFMASGALPPGFPAVEIEGEHYWDGGLVSNTPLQWVIDGGVPQDMLAFQVDLWSAKGQLPGNLPEVVTRQKEIQYSSRTRASTDQFKHVQRLRRALTTLLDRIPEELREHEDVKLLNTAVSPNVYNIVHLIYRARNHEGHSKDYEFSRLSMQDHWRAGYHDALRTLRHPEVLARPVTPDGVSTFDLEHDGRE